MSSATPLASGEDGAFDTGGRAYLFTSYDASSGGNIVNQVQRDFNGLSQLTKEYQSHSGAVNTGSTPKVQYAYSEMASGANHSRLTSMTYPNGTVITYDYGSAGGLHDKISRLDAIKAGSDSLEKYSYLGLATVVVAERTASNMRLTYLDVGSSDAGDQYKGYDRFGRTIGMEWEKASGSGGANEQYRYGYDRNGNVLFKDIDSGPGDGTNDDLFNELYHANGASNGYDSLNRLVEWRRGPLSDSNSDGILDTVTTAGRDQIYTMDAQGNFSSVNTSGTSTSRTHNSQNEISTFGTATLTYDSNGNLTTDETGKTLVWDAWNRLRQVKTSGGANIITFGIDALGRQVTEDTGSVRDMYYSPGWQLLEERTSGTARKEYVWGALYIDEMIRRRWDSDNNGSLDKTHYVLHDANFNTTAIVKISGNSPSVEEHYATDPYGGNVVIAEEDWDVKSGSDHDWKNFHQGLPYYAAIDQYHSRGRQLGANEQRFINHDPGGMLDGTNLYAAYGNGPVSRVDPSGLVFGWVEYWVYAAQNAPSAAGEYVAASKGLSWGRAGALGFIFYTWIVAPAVATYEQGIGWHTLPGVAAGQEIGEALPDSVMESVGQQIITTPNAVNQLAQDILGSVREIQCRQLAQANAPAKAVDFSRELTRDRGNATRSLRNALGTNSQVERPHHLIPWEAKELPVVQAAARGGFNLNGANNGVNLSLQVHPQGGRHPLYNDAIMKQLEALGKRNLTDTEAAGQVQSIADRLRPGLQRLNQSGKQLK